MNALALILCFAATSARGAVIPPPPASSATAPLSEATSKLVDQLATLRTRVIGLEGSLVDSLRSQNQAKVNVKKIQLLLQLQKQEREVGRARMEELQSTVKELEIRQATLGEKIKIQQGSIRKFLAAVESAEAETVLQVPASERTEAARRKLLSRLAEHSLKEMEALKADLQDDERLGGRIQEEKQQLTYLFQDLEEQQGVLELNRQLQVDLISRNRNQRIAQLDHYRKLKTAEFQVEHMISDFNARKELERNVEAETRANQELRQSEFASLKGHLLFPLEHGQVMTSFGRFFDPQSQLTIFKKGIDISAGKTAAVRAITGGKIAYSGELPDYGRVTIVDHGSHFYSLCAHLGTLSHRTGDHVAAGDVIGSTDEQGTPVYFEIRSRNVAVNPLQWVSN